MPAACYNTTKDGYDNLLQNCDSEALTKHVVHWKTTAAAKP
jgi:hypothetical protein